MMYKLFPVVLLLFLAATACSGGQRTTLIEPPATPDPTPTPPVVIDLPPAPEAALPLPPASPDLPLESSVDDALASWAIERNIAYVDGCQFVQPGPGELCDTPGDRDTVRLLGTSVNETWYIVIVDQVETDGLGVGYRVGEVRIAGR